MPLHLVPGPVPDNKPRVVRGWAFDAAGDRVPAWVVLFRPSDADTPPVHPCRSWQDAMNAAHRIVRRQGREG